MAGEFSKDFRRFFFRGLAAVLPTVLTLGILIWVLGFIHTYIGQYTNRGAQWIVVQFVAWFGHESMSWSGPPGAWRSVEGFWRDYWLVWIGFALAFVGIYIFGRFIASFIGRSVWRRVERGIFRLPIVKQVYPPVKQVTDLLFSDRKIEFSRVVAVSYPRKGIWSLGLVTSLGMKELQGPDNEMLTVFIPSSPMPVTGYTVTVRRDEVVDLPISIDEALRFTVSGGVVLPMNQILKDTKLQAPAQRQVLEVPIDSKETQE
ncbi:MAG: DUF502 domain-containing protein [Phycisphaerae bacterium]|nr:DUF502 domain-containing protein [Phycisphaerae bacterium]